MDANEFKVGNVLRRSERFVVPLYQRQYQWHDSYDGSRTSAFWQDVATKAGDVLNSQLQFEHYMGALLLAPGATKQSFGTTPVRQVVDGQQRLTTFLILLSAIRAVAEQQGSTKIVQECEKYLFNEPEQYDKEKEIVRFKLTPTPVDRIVFFDILDKSLADVRAKYQEENIYWGGVVPKNTKYRSLRAFEFFITQVKHFVFSDPGNDVEIEIQEVRNQIHLGEFGDFHELAHVRLSALLEALVFHLKLIVIELDEKDDAQVIFETLNSAGQPLLAMDLVRNNIFHRAEAQYNKSDGTVQHDPASARLRAEELYKNVWMPFDDAWWRVPAPSSRPRRPRIDHYLAYVLTTETGQRTTVRELYSEYRNWAMPKRRPRFENVEDELSKLDKHVPTYETLEGRKDGDEAIANLGERLRLWQNTTAYPIAFQIAEYDVDQETRRTIAKLLDSYLTRRALCGLTSKNLNRMFPQLVRVLREIGVSMKTLRNFFEQHEENHSTRFPKNADVYLNILKKQIYGRIRSKILAEILWNFELASRSTKTENTSRPENLWVEHIMPVSWEKYWPLTNDAEDSVGLDDPRYRQRVDAVHLLGNLTIVTAPLNMSLKNLPFREKKAELVEHSNLTLNRLIANLEYCEEGKEDWNEATIRNRGEALATLACEIWPELF